MKDYNRLVIWLDYFNSSLTRGDGRRVPLNMAVRNPTLRELNEASIRAGFDTESSESAHPKRMHNSSGYVSIERKKPKSQTIKDMAAFLAVIRGEHRREAKEIKG